MSDKYKWTEKNVINGGLERGTAGSKPKHLVGYLSRS